jgi:hypothetical protein
MPQPHEWRSNRESVALPVEARNWLLKRLGFQVWLGVLRGGAG